jgi:hypothetical protein
MEILLNGVPIHRHDFRSQDFEAITLTLDTRPGTSDLEFRYSESERIGARYLCVLFRTLQITPPPTAPEKP